MSKESQVINAVADEYTSRFRSAYKQSAQGVLSMAVVAADVRERYDYNTYIGWLGTNFQLSRQSGDNLLNVHKNLISTLNFSVDDADKIAPSALYLLAAPSTPAEVREEIVAEAKAGKKVTHAKAKAAVAKASPPKPKGKKKAAPEPAPIPVKVTPVVPAESPKSEPVAPAPELAPHDAAEVPDEVNDPDGNPVPDVPAVRAAVLARADVARVLNQCDQLTAAVRKLWSGPAGPRFSLVKQDVEGYIRQARRDLFDFQPFGACPACKATGKDGRGNDCGRCGGPGYITQKAAADIKKADEARKGRVA